MNLSLPAGASKAVPVTERKARIASNTAALRAVAGDYKPPTGYMYELTLLIPAKGLHPNHRGLNAFAHAILVKERRREACYMAVSHGVPVCFTKPIRVLTVWRIRNVAMRDRDNLVSWLKSSFDGLTDAHLWTDDRLVRPMEPVVIKTMGQETVTFYVYDGIEVQEL